jgi:chemotaxis protein methyltransferase WspC
MPLSQIIEPLRKVIGLDAASLGNCLIERAVKLRLSANHLRDNSQYAALLQCSDAELQNLVEEIVIPETYFFRYPESFVALRRIVQEQLLSGSRKMRFLSIPCSTGEEPYSIAMSLLDGGVSAKSFRIEAIDISLRFLETAKLSLFGSNSFRGTELKFRDRHFEKTDAGFRLSDHVRQCVHFEQGNVNVENFGFGREPYDLIFCRNLLIYLDVNSQIRAIKSLRQMLTKNGLLFVGPAETSLLTSYGFTSIRLPMTFAFQKVEAVNLLKAPKQRWPEVKSPTETPRDKALGKPTSAIFQKAAPQKAKQENESKPDLVAAEYLADGGRLEEAAQICELHLRTEGPSARAFHLLGLIRDCSGDQGLASEFYRKALYLEPDHYDALIHFALLKDKSGESAAAQTLKSRARRVLEETK